MNLIQNPYRIYDQVEGRDPLYNDNPPRVPWMFLNSLTGELFTCLDNKLGANIWAGTTTGQLSVLDFVHIPTASVEKTIAYTLGGYVANIGYDGDNLISRERGGRYVYKHNGLGMSYVWRSNCEAGSAMAICSEGVASLNGSSGNIDVLSYDTGAPVRSFAPISASMTAFCVHDDDLYQTDGNGPLYKCDGISSTIVEQINISQSYCFGICFYFGNLITSDREADEIYIHDGFSTNILGTIDSPEYPTGLTTIGENLVVSSEALDSLTFLDYTVSPNRI